MNLFLLSLLFAASCLCAETDTKQMSYEGQCRIMPGETLLLGGGRTFDKEWVYYAFLTLDILPAKKIVLE
jgi:hypothetical protein